VPCTRTGKEHTMVLFIVIIVKTFVHLQHKSNTNPLDYFEKVCTAIVKEFCTVTDLPDFAFFKSS
jgi:hypothetical protein